MHRISSELSSMQQIQFSTVHWNALQFIALRSELKLDAVAAPNKAVQYIVFQCIAVFYNALNLVHHSSDLQFNAIAPPANMAVQHMALQCIAAFYTALNSVQYSSEL